MDPNTRVNSAVAALGVSGSAEWQWSVLGIIHRASARYNEQERQAAIAKEAGNLITARLHRAVAYENARLLAAYYQATGGNDGYTVWSRREMRAHLQAFNPPNVIAEAIQGGRAIDNYVSEAMSFDEDDDEKPETEAQYCDDDTDDED